MKTIDKAAYIKNICDEKKGIDPVVLDLRGLSDITDFFVIVSATSQPHVNALTEYIEEGMRKIKDRAWRVDKDRQSSWNVIDFSDIIVHVFHKDSRGYYDLERLWADAPRS